MVTFIFIMGVVAWLRQCWRVWNLFPLLERIDKCCKMTKKRPLSLSQLNELEVELRLLSIEARRNLSRHNKVHARIFRAQRRVDKKLAAGLKQLSSGS